MKPIFHIRFPGAINYKGLGSNANKQAILVALPDSYFLW